MLLWAILLASRYWLNFKTGAVLSKLSELLGVLSLRGKAAVIGVVVLTYLCAGKRGVEFLVEQRA